MNINDFRSLLIEHINCNYNDVCVTENDVTKNNGVVLKGIVLSRKNRKLQPTIYLEKYFEDYKRGCSVEQIVSNIFEVEQKNTISGEFDESFFMEYEKVKPHLFAKLINRDNNKTLLNLVPNKQFLDLSIVVYCDVSKMCGMNASILIRNEHLDMWGIGEKLVIETAYENTMRLKYVLKDLETIISDIAGLNEGVMSAIDKKMYVLSNETSMYGAIYMTYESILNGFIGKIGTGVYIIPSSIHEVLIIPEKFVESEEFLNAMICQVNEENLDCEDVLSSHAYYYSTELGYRIV